MGFEELEAFGRTKELVRVGNVVYDYDVVNRQKCLWIGTVVTVYVMA